MHTELEAEDIQAIADKVVERLQPFLARMGRREEEDELMDAQALSKYMGVSVEFIYKLVQNKEIPHIKRGNRLLLFRKRATDKWLDSFLVPALSPPQRAMRLLKKASRASD